MCVFWGKIPNKLLTTRLLRTLARCCAERTTNSTGSGSEGVLLITVRCLPLGGVGKNVGELGQWTRHETWQQISIFDASNRFVSEKSNTKVYSEASLVERGRGKWERIAPQVVDGNDGLFSCLWVCVRLSTLLEEKCVYLAKKNMTQIIPIQHTTPSSGHFVAIFFWEIRPTALPRSTARGH